LVVPNQSKLGNKIRIQAKADFGGSPNTVAPYLNKMNRMTWVAVRKNGAWKIIHGHTSGPVNRDTMKVVLER